MILSRLIIGKIVGLVEFPYRIFMKDDLSLAFWDLWADIALIRLPLKHIRVLFLHCAEPNLTFLSWTLRWRIRVDPFLFLIVFKHLHFLLFSYGLLLGWLFLGWTLSAISSNSLLLIRLPCNIFLLIRRRCISLLLVGLPGHSLLFVRRSSSCLLLIRRASVSFMLAGLAILSILLLLLLLFSRVTLTSRN